MKLFVRHILLIALLMVFAPGARAEVEDGTVVDPRLVAKLMAWVEQQTGVKVPVLPNVVASRTQFRAILRGMGGSFAGRPQSVYLAGNVVLDNLSWDPEESTQISLLVHELVHHAQRYMDKNKWPCPDAREAEAYNLQNLWLENNGHSPFVQASWIQRVSSCPDTNPGFFLAQKPNE